MAHVVVGPCDPCCGPTVRRCTITCGECENVVVQFPESFVMGISYTPPMGATCNLLRPAVYIGDYDLTFDETLSDIDECQSGMGAYYGCNGYAALDNASRGWDINFLQACETCSDGTADTGLCIGVSMGLSYGEEGCQLTVVPIIQLHRWSPGSGGVGVSSLVQSNKVGGPAFVIDLDVTGYCNETGVFNLAAAANAAIGGAVEMTVNPISGAFTPTIPAPWMVDLVAF